MRHYILVKIKDIIAALRGQKICYKGYKDKG